MRPLTSAPLPGATPLQRPPSAAPGPGIEAVLHLVFRASNGITYLAEQFVRAPFRITRPFTLEDGSALLQLTHVAPGMIAGDTHRLDVLVEPGARAILIGASATKVHRMSPGTAASQNVTCNVMAGGTLEYFPGLTIPFPESEFVQSVEVALAGDARFGMLELWAMGRIERGEYLAFRRLSSRTCVTFDGQPCYLDALELCPGRTHVAGWGMPEGHRYMASGYWHWDTAAPADDLTRPDLLLVSGVPAAGHLYVRGLAHDGLELGRAVSTLLSRQRAFWGLPGITFERYSGLFGVRPGEGT